MVARVTTTQVQPGKTGEAVNIYRDSVVPAGKQQKGQCGYLLLANPDTSKGISIALWETQADLEASEANGFYQEQLAKFGSVFATPPITEHFEVRLQSIPTREFSLA